MIFEISSADHGKTWSDPIIVSGDGAGHDLGYPSTVQIEDGSLVTVWYEKLAGDSLAVLRQARWKLRLHGHHAMFVDFFRRLSPIQPEIGRIGVLWRMNSFFQPTFWSMLIISAEISS